MKQRYQYSIENSILNTDDEYEFSHKEYQVLYSFFVEYSLCGTQSFKKRHFTDYGWKSDQIVEIIEGKRTSTDIGEELKTILDLNRQDSGFQFTEQDNLKELFEKNELSDGVLGDYDSERGVIAKTNENNKYLKLFYRIRDGFAHGKFRRKLSSNNEKMIVIQDDDKHNVTARIIIKLDTLLSFATKIQKLKE